MWMFTLPCMCDSMEHRAASLVGQKLAAAQLLYGESVEGALIDQADSGHGFLADLARSVIERADVPDLGSLFRQVSLGGNGNGNANQELIGAPLSAQRLETAEWMAGTMAAMNGMPTLKQVVSTKQMALF